jgi:sec-independent protein translocase protein TatA
MPKISESAPVLLINESSDLLSQARREIGFGSRVSFGGGKRCHVTYCQEATADFDIGAARESPMKYLATSPDEQMLCSHMSLMASFMNLAGPDLIVILLIILVLFGAKKLPELARGMGSAIKEFQKAKDEFSDELHSAGKTDATEAKPVVSAPVATVPRIENVPPASTATEIRRDDQARMPGDKADQV